MELGQIAALNTFQRRREFHPMTCPGDHGWCGPIRELLATLDGWVCQCGEYRQEFGDIEEAMLKIQTGE